MRRRDVLALTLAAAAPLARAQGYPSRPVRIIVPQPPGGGFDTVGRLLADRLSRVTGQAFLVENRTGSRISDSGEVAGARFVVRLPAA